MINLFITLMISLLSLTWEKISTPLSPVAQNLKDMQQVIVFKLKPEICHLTLNSSYTH